MATNISIGNSGQFESNLQNGNAIKEGRVIRDMVLQVLVVVFFVSTVVINALANILPINGLTTGDLSDKYQIFITPAGYVFSIWSVIYLGLLAFSVYQALPSQRTNPGLQAIRAPFIFSSIVNMAWIVVWHYEWVPLSLAVMLMIIGSLITIYTRLRPRFNLASTGERWTTHIPFSIYLGWISVATIVNITVIFDYTGLSATLTSGAISAELWTAIMLGVATVVGLFFTQIKLDPVYGLVFVWAFIGIAVKHSDVPIVFGAGTVTAIIMGLSVLMPLLRRRSES